MRSCPSNSGPIRGDAAQTPQLLVVEQQEAVEQVMLGLHTITQTDYALAALPQHQACLLPLADRDLAKGSPALTHSFS